jgi:hypothetical protein
MKAQELRIGNWVRHKDIGLFTIKGINPHVDDYKVTTDSSWVYLKNCKPIPLTEEWLERFNWNPPKDIGVAFSLTTDEIHFVAGNYYKTIEYVHQLQNLYFALTGEELNQNK